MKTKTEHATPYYEVTAYNGDGNSEVVVISARKSLAIEASREYLSVGVIRHGRNTERIVYSHDYYIPEGHEHCFTRTELAKSQKE